LLKFFFGNHCANEYDGYFFFPGYQMFWEQNGSTISSVQLGIIGVHTPPNATITEI